jgi:hypothetical protein
MAWDEIRDGVWGIRHPTYRPKLEMSRDYGQRRARRESNQQTTDVVKQLRLL